MNKNIKKALLLSVVLFTGCAYPEYAGVDYTNDAAYLYSNPNPRVYRGPYGYPQRQPYYQPSRTPQQLLAQAQIDASLLNGNLSGILGPGNQVSAKLLNFQNYTRNANAVLNNPWYLFYNTIR